MELRQRGADFQSASRWRQRNGMAKCPAVKGLRVEIFLRPLQKNTTRPLMVGQGGAAKRRNSFRLGKGGAGGNALP